MIHARHAIRQALREALSGVQGLAGVVFDSSEIPEAIEAPWCFVWLGDELIAAYGLGNEIEGRKLERSTEMNADVFYRASSEDQVAGLSVAEGAEAIAAQIEAAVFARRQLRPLLNSCVLTGLSIARNEEGTQPVCRLRLTWQITYTTTEASATAV